MTPCSPRMVAVSIFATGEMSGHSLVDDQVYFDYLVDRVSEFIFYTSRYSAEQLCARHPGYAGKLRLLPAAAEGWLGLSKLVRSIRVEDGDHVIFFGYTERAVALFCFANLLRRFRLALVATNNLSSRRFRHYRVALAAFFRLVRPRLERLVVHTRFERDLAVRLDPAIARRVCVKKHHLMTPRAVTARPNMRPTVCFFGPAKPEKPVTPLAALMRADTGGVFDYRVFNIGGEEKRLLADVACGRVVEFVDDWPSDAEYGARVASATLVLLTHNIDFEGKLSGNLCDCVALGVPFIADRYEPVTGYMRTYGAIGYQYDFDSPDWATAFLADFDESGYRVRRDRLRQMANDYSTEAIRADLDRCLGLPPAPRS